MIELAKANPDIETLKIMFWMASSVVGVLILIVGFFITQQFRVLKTVTETVNNLKIIVEVIKSRQLGDGEFSKMKHGIIDKRLDEHSKRLDKNERDIAVIIEKVKRL